MPTSVAKVREALIARTERESLKRIAARANVPYGWVQQFYYGNIDEPGVIKFTKLAKYLGITDSVDA